MKLRKRTLRIIVIAGFGLPLIGVLCAATYRIHGAKHMLDVLLLRSMTVALPLIALIMFAVIGQLATRHRR